MSRSKIFWVMFAVIAIVLGSVAAFRFGVQSPEQTSFARGQKLALDNGCFHCHGPAGIAGTPNPNSKYKEVPTWQGGTAMMFIHGPDDIRHWVMEGHLPDDKGDTTALIHMPAFKDHISEDEFTDLELYLRAVMEIIPIEDSLAQEGYNILASNGCFGCHGPYGLGGGVNPGAFKTYIPGWEGKDYDDLVRDESELRTWILKGELERIENHPVARFFTKDQIIRMPAYESILSENDVDLMVHYIDWLRDEEFR